MMTGGRTAVSDQQRQRVIYSNNTSTRQAGTNLIDGSVTSGNNNLSSSPSLADRIAANNAAAAAMAAGGGGVASRGSLTTTTPSVHSNALRSLNNGQVKSTQPMSAYEKMPTPLYKNLNSYLSHSNAVPGTVSRLNTTTTTTSTTGSINNANNKMPVDPSSISLADKYSSAYNHSQSSSLFGNSDRNRILTKYPHATTTTNSSKIDERFGKLSMAGSESISANSYGLESRTNGVMSNNKIMSNGTTSGNNKYASSQFHPAATYNNNSSSSTSYMSPPSLSITSSSSTSNTSLGYPTVTSNNSYKYKIDSYEPSSSSSSSPSSSDMEYRGIVGLKNLGNTCYMNSVLQCLSNTRFLSEYILSEEYSRDLNKSLSKMKGQLFTAYANLIKTMWKSSANSVVSPSDLKLNIAKYAHRFQNYAQEDAEEFFIFLLNGLSDDTNLVQKKPTPVKFDEKAWDNLSDSDKSRDQWSRFLSLERSKISDMFTGQFRSTLKCTKCGYKSVTFDTFWDVNVPMAKKSMRLEDCLRLFIDEEVIDGTEKPLCQKCKDRNVFTKRFTIERLPKILVIHLKRFLFTPYSYKIGTNVDYPIEGLDVSKYLSSSVDPNISTNRAADECNRNCTYDLYAISLHSGHSQSSGHYYAYCRHPFSNRWYYYNDSSVRPIAPSSLQDADAYILFYQQRS